MSGQPSQSLKNNSRVSKRGGARPDDPDMQAWRDVCERVEFAYGESGMSTAVAPLFYGEARQDSMGRLDLFWSSYEVMKPAVYAKAPVPAVGAKFSDGDPVIDTAAELLERSAVTMLDLNNIDCTMRQVRDDLLFFGRGVMWLTYESDGPDGQRVCIEHVDRDDFRHECARYWDRTGWVARRAWLTKEEMRERFGDKIAEDANYSSDRVKSRISRSDNPDTSGPRKCGVWEIWHRADNKVYWATEGVPYILDESEPHVRLRDFFPCPRPAYGTTKLRTLAPIPDYERYAEHFAKISELTGRIYALLDWVKMKGLVPSGADTAEAIKAALADTSDATVIAVPAALIQGGTGDFVQWMPLEAIANAITGLVQARDELISKLYELSGISDIMRGATEAEETLGAQQLKSQYGSVRVREKIDELQRIAADVVKIASEIIADKFSQKNLLDMSGMKIPTRKEIEKRIKDIETAAEDEMKNLTKTAQEAAQKARQSPDGQQIDPDQANQKIAEAEVQKAQAAIEKVKADAQLKTFDLQQKQQVAQAQAQQDAQRFALEIEQTRGDLAETNAQIRKIYAEIQKMGVDASNQTRQQDREDVKASADIAMRQTDQAMQARQASTDMEFRAQEQARAERGEDRADRQQDFNERTTEGTE